MFDILDNRVKKKESKFNKTDNHKRVYIETYGCQMNISDSEIVLSVLSEFGYNESSEMEQADIILLNTCSVRDNAEQKIKNRLQHLARYKKNHPDRIIGILGCMAERLRGDLLEKEKVVDLIVGPDEYRKLPHLIENIFETGEKGIAVKLSKVETYDDITPVRKDGVTAFISVMRGCDKFCSFCVVPFTRGRERSRKMDSIVDEAKRLFDEGLKEVTLLGQNVNSYRDEGKDFSDLLKATANAVPEMRIRYTTSHPYDLSDKLLETMAEFKNICKYIHLPVQSGSDRVLKLMNREYSVEHYKGIIRKAKVMMPGIGLSTDIIAGFPTETEEEHRMTMELMAEVEYDGAFMFAYSPRENTKAYKYLDDIPWEIKQRRLDEIIEQQRQISYKINNRLVGKEKEILIETPSKKSPDYLMGRTDCNKSTIIPKESYKTGDFVKVKITKANSATIFAEAAG
ncbi:MAG: tRNA (N6-isopentenyl adenosine(37)-C2)-methylthiotransferase MiaB [Ignavibacteriae bacterium]|nr:tRNA (N6-isopentenyl adenosine(37)-C2)-methylthiotransferase MiaB [Ignavibacteriota bacterium]